MPGIRERFETFSAPGFYSRVDPVSVHELYIGLDDEGRRCIELRASFRPVKVSGTSAIEVNQYSGSGRKTLRFSLTDEEMRGMFCAFCEDLAEHLQRLPDETAGYNAILVRFYQWKKMFVPARKLYLTEPQIMGLIGELLFLKNVLFSRIGIHDAIKSWSGQELTHKDFSYGNTWTEVKAISKNAQSVRISSLEQLESEHEGELVVYALEKMSAEYNGIKLNTLFLDICSMINNQEDRDLFVAETALQGYECRDYYDDFVYEMAYCKSYTVSDSFPRLTKENVPQDVVRASYELNLGSIIKFEKTD